jgi:myo-inositol-1(or 4)-monophosphatase
VRGLTVSATDARDHAALLEIALDAATLAARLVVDERPRGPLQVTATKSSATDIVTVMDQRAERAIVEHITAARPEDGFLGEEGSSAVGSSGVTWVVDPIDGTVNYLYEIPSYAVSVAASVGGRVVAGAVVNPVSGERWTAARGQGARLDGRPIHVHAAPELAMALVATGFGYEPGRRARQAEILRTVLPRVRDVRRAGAASLDLCAVACGRVDAYYEQGLKPWDLAAGGLVAEEAGAVVGGLRGQPAGEALVVAAPPGLYEPLAQLLTELGADEVAGQRPEMPEP